MRYCGWWVRASFTPGDDVIRYLIKEGGFDILSVTDTSVTLCAPDEPEETLTLTGWVFSSSFRLAD